MKKVIVKNVSNEVLQVAKFDNDKAMNDWLEVLATTHPFGKPEITIHHKEIPEVIGVPAKVAIPSQQGIPAQAAVPAMPEIPAVFDENGVEISAAVPAQEAIPIIPAEYLTEIVDITEEENEKLIALKYDSLWRAANDFQSSQISGAAIGLLTIGVLMSKPKCFAVQNWIKVVWSEYYTRKAAVNLKDNVNLDFSVCGNIPHSVPELMEEVSV